MTDSNNTLSVDDSQPVQWTSSQNDQLELGNEDDEALLDSLSTENQEGNQDNPDAKPEEAPSGTESATKEAEVDDLREQVAKNEKAISDLKKDLKTKGFDFNEAVAEYEATGALSDKTLANLMSAGYPQTVVESFIESRKALENRFVNAVYDSVGGEKEYNRIVNWASQNLSQKTVDSFNRALDNNNIDAITLMLEGMKSKMVARHGTRNPAIVGANTSSTANKGFTSRDEVIKAMSDPRYGRDSKYTREIELKMFNTPI